jgi:uncharacterized protein (TIGR02246 family)
VSEGKSGVGVALTSATEPEIRVIMKQMDRPSGGVFDPSGGNMPATQINDTITKFTDAFHVNDLDRVMSFFSDDAIYEPGDGRTHRGKAQIRAAFEPQFHGAYGAMRFDERDRVIDLENNKAAFRWVCRHDISHSRPNGLVKAFQKLIVGWPLGDASWHFRASKNTG